MLSLEINPVIFRVWEIQVSWYALIYIAGFAASLFVLLRASKNKKIDLDEKEVYDFVILGIASLLIGARLFHVLFWGFEYYFSQPARILYFWLGGFSFHGGLVGALLFSWIYCKTKNKNFWKIADILALLGVLMPVFSRIANFINQEIVGTITNLPWCFNFKNYFGCRHPVQIYAAMGRALYFSVLVIIKNKIKIWKDGFVFWLFIFGVGAGRFALDFLREDTKYYALSAGQWLSIPMILLGAYLLLTRHKEDLKKCLPTTKN